MTGVEMDLIGGPTTGGSDSYKKKEKNHKTEKPQPANNLEKYKTKHSPKNKVILKTQDMS